MAGAIFLVLCFLLFSPQPDLLFSFDLDNDGVDDVLEEELARTHMPLLFFTEEEQCPGPGVVLYHVRPYAPGVDTILSITYVLLFYEDCGGTSHKGDAESFSLTLYEDEDCTLGYRVHSLRTYAHRGAPLCEYISTVPVDRCDYGAGAGDILYVSENKHAIYRNSEICNSEERWFCEEACQDGLLMYNGVLIIPEAGQSWFLFNAGEPDLPFIENLSEMNGDSIAFSPCAIWDYGPFCGDESYSPGEFCPATIVNKLFYCSSGPSLPVDVAYSSGGAVPSPMGFCRDQFLYLDLPFGGNVIAHIYDLSGSVTDKIYLPFFCAEDDLYTPYWDGRDMYGSCTPPANYYLVVEAQRGDCYAQTGPLRFGVAGDEARPNAPTNLEGEGNSFSVSLAWEDHSSIEEAYIVERAFDTCPFAVTAVLVPNTTSWIDTPGREGTARYRVLAHRTLGGNSSFSNELELDLRWDIAAPLLSGHEGQGPHTHILSWEFDPGEASFGRYVLKKRYRIPAAGCGDGGVPPDWSTWYRVYESSDPSSTGFYDSSLVENNCYEYRVAAEMLDPPDTLFSNIENFHGDCEPNNCPVLYAERSSGWKRVTNLFPSCELEDARLRPRELRSRTRSVFLGDLPEGGKGVVTLRIAERSDDSTFLDEAALLAVPGREEFRTGVSENDMIITCGTTVGPERADGRSGEDVLNVLIREDGLLYRGGREDELVLEFDRKNCVDSLFGIVLELDGPTVKAAEPRIWGRSKRNGWGEWTHVHTLFPHQNRSTLLVSLAGVFTSDEQVFQLKLDRIGHLAIDHVFLTSGSVQAAGVRHLELIGCQTDRGQDEREKVLLRDGIPVILEKGGSLTLYFRKPPAIGRRYEYYLLMSGHYVKDARHEVLEPPDVSNGERRLPGENE